MLSSLAVESRQNNREAKRDQTKIKHISLRVGTKQLFNSVFLLSTGTLGIILSISLAGTLLAVVIAVLVVKCYLNWKKQHRKELRLAEGAVQQLVVSSQPVDFIPLLIQDRLEEEEEDDEFDSAFITRYPSGASTEDVSGGQTKTQTNWKVR